MAYSLCHSLVLSVHTASISVCSNQSSLKINRPTARPFASFPSPQTPRCAGKKVFVIHRQQAIMPNHCSSSNKSCLLQFYSIAAPAMPFGLLSQVCHAACSSGSFLTAATVSFTSLRSFLPSFRFITPRS